MPLTMSSVGTPVTVRCVNGKDETRRFLQSLGFVEGQQLTVVSKLGGNVIVTLKDSRVALDRSMANRVHVA